MTTRVHLVAADPGPGEGGGDGVPTELGRRHRREPPSSLPNGVRAPRRSPIPPPSHDSFASFGAADSLAPVPRGRSGRMTASRGTGGARPARHRPRGHPVPDLDAAIAFHTAVLGLVLLHREENAEQGVAEAMLAAPEGVPALSCSCSLRDRAERAGPLPGAVRARPAAAGLSGGRHRPRRECPSGKGLRLLYDAARTGTGGSRINFVHPKDTGGVLIELVERLRPSSVWRQDTHGVRITPDSDSSMMPPVPRATSRRPCAATTGRQWTTTSGRSRRPWSRCGTGRGLREPGRDLQAPAARRPAQQRRRLHQPGRPGLRDPAARRGAGPGGHGPGHPGRRAPA